MKHLKITKAGVGKDCWQGEMIQQTRQISQELADLAAFQQFYQIAAGPPTFIEDQVSARDT
jgi:hypothetical protein